MNTKEIIKYIHSDLYRYTKSISLKNFIIQYFFNRGGNYMVYFRLCQHSNFIISKISFVILNIKRIKYKIDISHKTKIGYGFYIGHSGPIVINPTTIIGNNVNMSEYTSIGANEGEAAVIGDNITIGVGSVVTKNIPTNATAVGNYAKVINYNLPAKYINNKFVF
ncbi:MULTISPECIES: hypothetical protein [unclassified Empedobacter]|uniref:hypothetical protein n=1 Tax=unclassified Empedobacter TaxID=2643773 RepID=UPI0025B8C806|nr:MULTISPECIES: hypothetical protein [unclassified Empedobacter]